MKSKERQANEETSSSRFAQRQTNERIILRNATLKDCKFIFDLRNKGYVRKNLWDSSKLNYARHKKWFKKNYKNYYIINENQGCVRVNKDDSSSAIYIAILKKYQKGGIGTKVIKKISKKYKNLTAQVKIGNMPSQKMFLKAGFKKVGIIFKKSS